MQLDAIPAAMREDARWVCWDWRADKLGKPTKVPLSPHGGKADSTDAATWGAFEQAVTRWRAEELAGLGFVLGGGWCGIDMDDCVVDGEMHPAAQVNIQQCASYAEISPSGEGVKVFGRGVKPEGVGCKTRNHVEWPGEIEVYDRDRFFTVTGNTCAEYTDAADITVPMAAICRRHWPPQDDAATLPPPTVAVTGNDRELIERIASSLQGDKFLRLWGGDASDFNGDASSADASLAMMLVWWTQHDADRADRLFRQSGLMRPKWDEKRGQQTYGERTIAGAMAKCRGDYQPKDATPPAKTIPPPPPIRSGDVLSRRMQELREGKRRPAPLPFTSMHGLTKALRPGTVTMLCGSPGASKSFLLLQCLSFWYESGISASCLMLEDDQAFHLQRVFAQVAGKAELTDDEWCEANADEVADLLDQHGAYLHGFQPCIHEPANGSATPAAIIAWVQARADAGDRVICVDPITLADTGDKQHVEDRKLLTSLKQIAKVAAVSIIVVSHPVKVGGKPEMGAVAGGSAWTRATQTVLWLEHHAEMEQFCCSVPPAYTRQEVEANRVMHILKARSARGQGKRIAMVFDGATLTFGEWGAIVKRGG